MRLATRPIVYLIAHPELEHPELAHVLDTVGLCWADLLGAASEVVLFGSRACGSSRFFENVLAPSR